MGRLRRRRRRTAIMLLSYKNGGSSSRRDDSDHIYHLNMPDIDDIHRSRHGAGLTHERHTRGYIDGNESNSLNFPNLSPSHSFTCLR